MTDISALEAALPRLDPRGREFASSLITQAAGRRGLSPKQWEWVDKLVARAAAGGGAAAEIGSVAGIIELFDRAQRHLRRPAILLRGPDGDLRLALAGARARVPGSINVTSADRGDWYGRVTRDGVYEPCRRYDAATIAAVTRGLRAMAEDPAGQAAAYGHLTGACCFCNRALTDERSTTVGYGPVCAGHYGLPWGEREAA